MDKNTVWFMVFSTAIIIGGYYMNIKMFPPQQADTSAPAAQAAALEEPKSAIFEIQEGGETGAEETVLEEKVIVKTDFAEITLTNRGGDIVSYELLGHMDGKIPVQMAQNVTETNRAFALALGGEKNPIVDELLHIRRIDDYTVGFFRDFSVKTAKGVSHFTLAKRYAFKKDDYLFKLDVSLSPKAGSVLPDFEGAAYTLLSSPQIGPDFDHGDRYEYRAFMSYTNEKRKERRIKDGKNFIYNDAFAWTGVAGKYFTSLIIPLSSDVKCVEYSAAAHGKTSANAQSKIVRKASSGEIADSYYVFLGPRTEKALEVYNDTEDNSWGAENLRLNESLSSSGILSWLEAFLKWVMQLLYGLIPNWGVAIIIVTFLIKLLFFPLTKKSSEASLKMQELQPQIQEIQERYKDTPEKLQAEMIKFQTEAGYNPLSGCLPLLIQFPILIAMYNLFNHYFEFRGAMFIPGWIPDLSKGDSILHFGFSIPFLGEHLRLLPIIYLFSQILFTKLMQSPSTGQNAAQMKIMMYGMPIIFFFMFYNAPSGLILYWTVSNVLQLFQQLLIKKITPVKTETKPKSKFVTKKRIGKRKK